MATKFLHFKTHLKKQKPTEKQLWYYSNIAVMLNKMKDEMWPDFGKPTKLSHLVFREIPILNIQATVFPLC